MIAVFFGLGLLVALPQGNTLPPTASLDGYVRDAASGTPLAGARVTLDGAGAATVISADGQGRVAFAAVVPGRYRLVAEMDGFAFDPASVPVVMLGARQAASVNINMPRAAVVAGEVHDEHGDPRGGVSVTAIRRTTAGGTEMSLRAVAVTNDLGEFRVGDLLPGEYVILASPPAQRATRAAVMPTYYPAVTEQRSATIIPLVSGQTISGILVTMQSAPAYEITGTVVDERGQPVRALIVFVSQSIQTWDPNQSAGMRVSVSGQTTGGDGTFRITGLGPGTYRLTPVPAPATRPQQLPPEIMAAAVNGNRSTIPVDVHDADVTGVTVVFRPPTR